jgi:hypothetical protein
MGGETMEALKKWLRKVATGVAALLMACWQALGSVDLSHHMMMPFGGPNIYLWTQYGMRVQMDDENPIARTEEEVSEDRIRMSLMRDRAGENEKAAS